jgi:BASS family bile acid:Na+ symporter
VSKLETSSPQSEISNSNPTPSLSLSALHRVSNTAAFVMMPLLLILLGPAFTSDDMEIPYASVFVGLLVVLIPVAIGMTILRKSPAVAAKLEKFASTLGGFFIFAAIVAGLIQNTELLTSGYKLYAASILMAPCGYACGYGLAALGNLAPKQRRTIALETGIQNSTLTIAIIMLTYPGGTEEEDQLQQDVLAFALMYSLFLIISGCFVTLGFRHLSKDEPEDEPEEATAVEKKVLEPKEIEAQTLEVAEIDGENAI